MSVNFGKWIPFCWGSSHYCTWISVSWIAQSVPWNISLSGSWVPNCHFFPFSYSLLEKLFPCSGYMVKFLHCSMLSCSFLCLLKWPYHFFFWPYHFFPNFFSVSEVNYINWFSNVILPFCACKKLHLFIIYYYFYTQLDLTCYYVV